MSSTPVLVTAFVLKPSLADLQNARIVITIAVVTVTYLNNIRRESLSCATAVKLHLAVG